jgi:tRNA(Ile)-lysidine synthase
MRPSDDLVPSLSHWLRTFAPHARVCVAFSGGVDSSVLLHALLRARAEAASHAELQISAVHIHHGVSPNADAWAAHCERIAGDSNVPCSVVRVRVEHASKIGIEAAARAARYEALREHATQTNTIIALAHHARDQAETVLLQLLRGAGPAGLSAMPEAAAPFARPLLRIEKSRIDEYASRVNLDHIVDESNADNRFARNRLRNTVWPQLTAAFPSAERTLSRAATWQQESDELATALAQIDLSSCEKNATIIASAWRQLTSARRRNAMRLWLAKNGVTTPSSERLTEWEKQLLTDNETQNVLLTHASFAGSIRLFRDRIHYVAPTATRHEDIALGVRWLGESSVSFGEGAIHFHETTQEKIDNSTHVIRPISLRESWVIRSRRDGDSIVLSLKSGSVSLKNVFQNADIPPWLRAEWPVLTCNGVIAALPGLAVAGAFRPHDGEPCIALEWKLNRREKA